jgi:hypothetical protein
MLEPRYPSLKIVFQVIKLDTKTNTIDNGGLGKCTAGLASKIHHHPRVSSEVRLHQYSHWKFTIIDLDVQMILPQVHLRKPCYDFSFL